MPFPAGWPPRVPSGVRNIRFFVTGTSTAGFDDNGFLFVDGTGANPYTPLPVVRPGAGVSNPMDPGPHVVPPVPAGTGESRPGEAKAMIWSQEIRITHTGGAGSLEFSFDGTNVHGVVTSTDPVLLMSRAEAGVAIRGSGGTPTFRIEAW